MKIYLLLFSGTVEQDHEYLWAEKCPPSPYRRSLHWSLPILEWNPPPLDLFELVHTDRIYVVFEDLHRRRVAPLKFSIVEFMVYRILLLPESWDWSCRCYRELNSSFWDLFWSGSIYLTSICLFMYFARHWIGKECKGAPLLVCGATIFLPFTWGDNFFYWIWFPDVTVEEMCIIFVVMN